MTARAALAFAASLACSGGRRLDPDPTTLVVDLRAAGGLRRLDLAEADRVALAGCLATSEALLVREPPTGDATAEIGFTSGGERVRMLYFAEAGTPLHADGAFWTNDCVRALLETTLRSGESPVPRAPRTHPGGPW